MLLVSRDLAQRLVRAIRSAQSAGTLPHFQTHPIKVLRATKPDHGDYSTPVALVLSRSTQMAPSTVAEAIITHFPPTDYLARIEQVRGFINFRLADAWLQHQVDHILDEGVSFGNVELFAGQRVQVECASANPTGPLTVGRARGAVLGDTVARLLRAQGYVVELEYYYNNAGRQMRVLGESLRARYLERLGSPFLFPEEGYKGDYLYPLADELIAEQGDTWVDVTNPMRFKEFAEERIMAMIQASLARINIHFDHYFNENWLYEDNSVWDTLDRLAAKGLVYKAIHPETDPDADESPDVEELEAPMTGPAIWLRTRDLRVTRKDRALVKADGEPTYRLPDIAYHINKLERGFDLMVNVLGADHIEEYKDVKAALGGLGYDAERLQVVIHQFVTLRESGVTRRMSTREGEYVTSDELIDAVGPDAVRYFMLERSPDSHINFDLNLARKKSDENPVYYVQNAHVRCAGIGRVALERGLSLEGGSVTLLTGPSELALVRKLVEVPEMVDQALQVMSPHILAQWAHTELARRFHRTYEETRALDSNAPENVVRARLKLYAAAKIVLARVLELMGMNAPEFM